MTNTFEVKVGTRVVKTTTSQSEALAHARSIRKENSAIKYEIGATVTILHNGKEVYRQTVGRSPRMAR